MHRRREAWDGIGRRGHQISAPPPNWKKDRKKLDAAKAIEIPKTICTSLTPGATAARSYSRDKIDFRSDMEISIIVAGKAANGLEYGAEIELQMDANNTSATAIDTDEMWMFFRSPTLGTIQLGDQDSAADQLKVNGAVTVANVSGFGYSGQWDEFVVPNSDGTRYLLTSINDGSDATKIIYLSPSFFGFDFGVSYAPNADEGENFLRPGSTTTFQRDRLTIRNEWSGAIRYRGSFGNVGVAASFSAMRADAQETNGVLVPAGGGAVARVAGLQDVTQYEIGAGLSAFGFGINGFYSWGKFGGPTRTPLRQGLENSTNWGLVLTYQMGPLAVAALYGESQRDNGAFLAAGGGSLASANPSDRKQAVISIGAQYILAPGLALFASYSNIDDKNISNSTSNPTAWAATGRNRDIDVFVLGTRLTF
ncbi:porin [Leptolyngbya sp. 15MV]|nr:porin [Leptolyngbya sp. 15MV]